MNQLASTPIINLQSITTESNYISSKIENILLDNKTTTPTPPNECQMVQEQQFIELGTFWYVFLALITTIGLLVSFASNMIIIYLFSRTPALRRNPSNLVAINLSFSDLLYCIQWPSIIYSSITQSTRILEINGVCKSFGFITSSTASASILTVLVMSVERAIVITNSLQAKNRINTRTAWLIIVLIWICSFATSLPPLFDKYNRYTLDPSKTSCTLDYLSSKTDYKLYVLLLYAVYWILPAIIISISYALIIVAFKRSSTSLQRIASGGGDTVDLEPQRNEDPKRGRPRKPILAHQRFGSSSLSLIIKPPSERAPRPKAAELDPDGGGGGGAFKLGRRRLRNSIRPIDKLAASFGRLPRSALVGPKNSESAGAGPPTSPGGDAAKTCSVAPAVVTKGAAADRGVVQNNDTMELLPGGSGANSSCERGALNAAPPAPPEAPEPPSGRSPSASAAGTIGGTRPNRGLEERIRLLAKRCDSSLSLIENCNCALSAATPTTSGRKTFDCATAAAADDDEQLATVAPPEPGSAKTATKQSRTHSTPLSAAAASLLVGQRRRPVPGVGLARRSRTFDAGRLRPAASLLLLLLPPPPGDLGFGADLGDDHQRRRQQRQTRRRFLLCNWRRQQSTRRTKTNRDSQNPSTSNSTRSNFSASTVAAHLALTGSRLTTSTTTIKQTCQLTRTQMQIRLAKMSFYLIVLWLVSWTPIASLAMINSVIKCHQTSATAIFLANTMTKLGPAFDVFIYGLSHPKIKFKFKQIIKRVFVIGGS